MLAGAIFEYPAAAGPVSGMCVPTTISVSVTPGAFTATSQTVTPTPLSGKVEKVMHRSIQAVSVGIVDGEARLDLMYEEDVAAEVDMNVVCTGDGDFVEVQGTGEANVFRRDQLDALLDLGVQGCADLALAQQKALAS